MSKLVKVLTSPLSLISNKLGKIVQGAFLVGAGIVTGNPALVAAGLSRLISAFQKTKARIAEATTVQIGEVPRSGIFGQAATAGSLVDAFNYGGKYDTDWTVIVFALADHLCHSLVGFYVNDKYVSYTGDGTIPGFRDQLQVFWRPGSWDQTVPTILTLRSPVFPPGHPLAGQRTWTENDRGRGVAYVAVAYKADKPDAKKPVWTNGRPQFLWVIKGLLCYSARDDSSVGGSGPHRWDDPSTREWSENLYDCRYTWQRGIYAGDKVNQPEMLLLGRGLSAIEAPPANVFARANICDEPVPLKAGGTEPRYRVGGVWTADKPFIEIEQAFAAACGGVIIEREGAVEIDPGRAMTPAFTFTDDDLITGTRVTRRDVPIRTDGEWVNTVSPRYIEPSQKWKDHAAPVRRVVGDILTDAGPRELQLALDFVTSGTQAQRIGEMARRLGRLWRRRTVTLGPRFAGAEHGDWCVWNSARYGGSILFRVESDSLGPDWRNTMTLRQMSASYADWNAAVDELEDKSVVVGSNVPGDVGAPSPADWSLAAVMLTGDGGASVGLQFTGTVTDEYATAAFLEYSAGSSPPSATDDAAWTLGSMIPPGSSPPPITGVLAGTTYYGAVSYRVDNERGDRLILGPVTTPTLPGAAGRWSTESGGRWMTETGGQWIREAA